MKLNPSNLLILYSLLENISNKIGDRIKNNISVELKLEDVTFPNIKAGSAKTIPMLNILLPIIFPTNISCSF